MKIRHDDPEPLDHEPLLLGEGPSWDAESATLSLVDIAGRALLIVTDQGTTRIPVADDIGCAVPWRTDQWLAAVGTDLLAVSRDGSVGEVAKLPADPATHRANDGKCDPAGRLWVGVMARDAAAGAGLLCVAREHGRVETVLTGLTIPNGLGWSPDGTVMYVTDSVPGTITAYDFDPGSGRLGESRTLITIDPRLGAPDGLTVDAEGHLWTALWDGGAVLRFAPDGALVGVLELPVARLTSCCFAGPDLTELIVTTASIGLDQEALGRYPASGSTYRVRTGIRGLPASRLTDS
ncbi:SMP-30/gluconolactonase/LRE family protein [Kitasatospora azatica]|uniref:SMP-30/gluconolactonase/LRE family protein n=1 Tax=Kitasatospora azatica TaxID=58347 RepID=UPI00068ACB81|nr:SMP-30/gluconolactonase/LRE family protein [Kitasatospora azatica]